MYMITQKKINDKYFDKEINVMQGFDKAILGIENESNKISYSLVKLIEVCIKDGKSFEQAVNFVRYNIIPNNKNQFIFIDDFF
jgi:hypothetical protein